jgi:hypothetical protein
MSDQPAQGRQVLLDEMLPRLLARELPGHVVTTVAQRGWAGILNGELLRTAEAAGVEVFVTADRNLQHQQRVSGRAFGVVVIAARGTKLTDLALVGDALRDAVQRVSAGELINVSAPPAAT